MTLLSSVFVASRHHRRVVRGLAVWGVVLGALGWAAPARAQDSSIVAPFIGFTTGGDTNTNGFTFGLSTAYIEESGWGAEFDIAHSTSFNDVEFESSGLTTMMFNVIGAPKVIRRLKLRPYGVAGVGVIRARGCTVDCVREVSRTDFGLDAGGGVFWQLDDAWGLRGDVRYFRYAQVHRDLPRLDNGTFDFWRITVAGTYTW